MYENTISSSFVSFRGVVETGDFLDLSLADPSFKARSMELTLVLAFKEVVLRLSVGLSKYAAGVEAPGPGEPILGTGGPVVADLLR